MRFHLGAIPPNPDFDPSNGWTPLKELSPWMFQVAATPVALLNLVVFGGLWCAFTPLVRTTMSGTEFLVFISLLPVLVMLHELIHAWTHPFAGRSRRSIIGLWPSRAMFYAHYDGELKRNRFLAILLMPLFVISVVPLIISILFQAASPLVAAISITNALFACGDVLGAGLLLWQLPARAIARNHGWTTYWRIAPAAAAA